jgi:hypothetical protein
MDKEIDKETDRYKEKVERDRMKGHGYILGTLETERYIVRK